MLKSLAAACVLTLTASSAYAQDTSAPKRTLPDYDGRGPTPTTAGDVLLWVPRIAVSPIYFTTEYIFRRPMGAFLTWAERANAFQSLYDFFAFGPNHKAGFAPIAFFDFGFNPSFGVYLFWDDALTKGNDLAFHGTTWGADWLAGVWTDRVAMSKKTSFTFNTTAIKRPDHEFFGVGSDSLQQNLSRYGETMVDVSGAFDMKPTRGIELRTTSGIRSADFFPGYGGIFYPNDPSIEKVVDKGGYPLPDGFITGYTAVYEHLSLTLDSRKPRPAPGSGIRVTLDGETAGDIRSKDGWVRYGGTIAGFWDITGTNRVLSLSFATAFADSLTKDPVPFTELAALGGDLPMPGYLPGRLFDRSSAVLTLAYRWPVWMWLDGTIQAAVGNVFDEHLDNFRPGLFRFSGAIGLESSFSLTNAVNVLVGFGSETFEHGGQITSARFLIGSSRGF